MSNRAHGRGLIAALGLLVLFAGLVGGVVLWIVAAREPNDTADGFARAAPGCTTTVTFSEPGEYYVFEELSGVVATVEGCAATTTPGQTFAFDVRPPGGEPVDRVTDTSVSYDLDAGQATSVARITIESAGDYAVSVLGSDPAVNAAIGDDPDEGVDDLRRAAIAAVIVGLVVGGLLLLLAGRRSRKAATFTSPLDPGWGVTERDHKRRAAADDTEWAAPVSGTQQVPVNPHQPDQRRVAGAADAAAGPGAWAPAAEWNLPEPVLPGDAPPRPTDGADVETTGTDDAGPDNDADPVGVETTGTGNAGPAGDVDPVGVETTETDDVGPAGDADPVGVETTGTGDAGPAGGADPVGVETTETDDVEAGAETTEADTADPDAAGDVGADERS